MKAEHNSKQVIVERQTLIERGTVLFLHRSPRSESYEGGEGSQYDLERTQTDKERVMKMGIVITLNWKMISLHR